VFVKNVLGVAPLEPFQWENAASNQRAFLVKAAYMYGKSTIRNAISVGNDSARAAVYVFGYAHSTNQNNGSIIWLERLSN
jgi:hypothetical protein